MRVGIDVRLWIWTGRRAYQHADVDADGNEYPDSGTFADADEYSNLDTHLYLHARADTDGQWAHSLSFDSDPE